MFRKWLGSLFQKTTARPSKAEVFRPALETLENRVTPTVNYFGGGVLPHVEVQNLFLGSDWNTAQGRQVAGQFETFTRSIVNSSYMDMLTNAGYGVGRGSDTSGIINYMSINKSYYLTDAQIRADIQASIAPNGLARPDANRLYVVYVEPGVAVMDGSGATSIRNFMGYHNYSGSFSYAVIPYQNGFNAHDSRVSLFSSMTETVTHELAEAVTDPIPGRGWYDRNYNGEIGDIANHSISSLMGYVVSNVVNKYDQVITPAGSVRMTASAAGAMAASSVSSPAAVRAAAIGQAFADYAAVLLNPTGKAA